MKFKFLIIAFCIVIIFATVITALLPVLLAGSELAQYFTSYTLPLLIFMILLLIGIAAFFLSNYRLFSLLEREDWPALSYYLEQIIFVKGRYSNRNVRLLASSYLVISDFSSVIRLEGKVMAAKPSIINNNVLTFGVARVLSGNYNEAAAFFKSYLEKGKANERQWIRWYCGFSYLLNSAFSMAEPEFISLAVSSDDALITGLSAYFLETSIAKYSLKSDECRSIAKNGRDRVKKALKNMHDWKKEEDKTGTAIHITVIKKYIDETGIWLFSGT